MSLEPNLLLIGLQLIPFLVTLLGLYFIIFKPMLAYLDDRQQAMTRGREDAEALEVRIQERLDAHHEQLDMARTEIAALRKQRRAEATEVYTRDLGAARVQSDAQITEALLIVESEFQVARTELAQNVEALAADIADRVLGQNVAVA